MTPVVKKYLLLIFVVWLLPTQVLAVSEILSVKVKGNRRVETTAILRQVRTKKMDTLNQQAVRKSIENIYKLGFF